jgi:hypothetical protein
MAENTDLLITGWYVVAMNDALPTTDATQTGAPS